MSPRLPDSDNDLLTPREVAELFGVRTTTIARWAREGRFAPIRTPGGHRRYARAVVRAILEEETTEEPPERRRLAEDAARLYGQGWSIRQVADRFGCGYTAMRRILGEQVALRGRGAGGRDG